MWNMIISTYCQTPSLQLRVGSPLKISMVWRRFISFWSKRPTLRAFAVSAVVETHVSWTLHHPPKQKNRCVLQRSCCWWSKDISLRSTSCFFFNSSMYRRCLFSWASEAFEKPSYSRYISASQFPYGLGYHTQMLHVYEHLAILATCIIQFKPNVGKYSTHGTSGISFLNPAKKQSCNSGLSD